MILQLQPQASSCSSSSSSQNPLFSLQASMFLFLAFVEKIEENEEMWFYNGIFLTNKPTVKTQSSSIAPHTPNYIISLIQLIKIIPRNLISVRIIFYRTKRRQIY